MEADSFEPISTFQSLWNDILKNKRIGIYIFLINTHHQLSNYKLPILLFFFKIGEHVLELQTTLPDFNNVALKIHLKSVNKHQISF